MRYTRFVALVLLAVHLPACTSYQTLADPVADLQASPKPVKKVWVTLQSGAHFQLTSPYVEGDSIRGVSELSRATSVPMADVVRVEVRTLSAAKTVGLILAIPVVIFGSLLGLCALSGCMS